VRSWFGCHPNKNTPTRQAVPRETPEKKGERLGGKIGGTSIGGLQNGREDGETRGGVIPIKPGKIKNQRGRTVRELPSRHSEEQGKKRKIRCAVGSRPVEGTGEQNAQKATGIVEEKKKTNENR